MISKITGGSCEKIFSAKVLGKYTINYFRCKDTGFIQTEDPYWLDEAYSSAITKLDVGLVYRNEKLRNNTIPLINKHFNPNRKFLDYAGGYGLFTRMMRDKGYDFYHTDAYCDNLFAEFFDMKDLPINFNFELITAFEVFEHLPNPINEIKLILQHSENLLFTTELQPKGLKTIEDWWYFIPETGQHVSLFTKMSLQYIAKELGYYFYTNDLDIHLFTKNSLGKNPFIVERIPFFIRTMKRKVDRYFRKVNPIKESLLQDDWGMIKRKLNNP